MNKRSLRPYLRLTATIAAGLIPRLAADAGDSKKAPPPTPVVALVERVEGNRISFGISGLAPGGTIVLKGIRISSPKDRHDGSSLDGAVDLSGGEFILLTPLSADEAKLRYPRGAVFTIFLPPAAVAELSSQSRSRQNDQRLIDSGINPLKLSTAYITPVVNASELVTPPFQKKP